MDDYQSFLKNFRTKRFKKGEIILVQGEVPETAYVIKNGIIKSYNLTTNGEEKPIGFDMHGGTLPLGWIFGKIRHTQYYYEAFTDAELFCVPTQELKDFFAKYAQTRLFLLDRLVTRHVFMQLRINALEQSKASKKVLNTLHVLCLSYGEEVKPNTVKINLPLTQQDLANFIGLTRETTGIELKKLQKNGVLTSKKHYYLVHTDKLDDLLDEDYGLGFVIEGRPKTK